MAFPMPSGPHAATLDLVLIMFVICSLSIKLFNIIVRSALSIVSPKSQSEFTFGLVNVLELSERS